MKKKGFTLIELLAVIVILAIIALIATPLVLKYIETSRIESFKGSVENIKDSAIKYVASKQFNGIETYPVTVNVNDLDFKGKEDYTGKVIVYKDGSVEEYIEKDSYRSSNSIVVNGKSEPYLKVKEGKTAVVDEKNKFVYSFYTGYYYSSDRLSLSVLENIFEGVNAKVKFEMNSEETYSTGAKILLEDEDGNILKEYQIVIFGDVNGDGHISVTDSSFIDQHVYNISSLNSIGKFAADINRNGTIQMVDSNIVFDIVSGICDYNQITNEYVMYEYEEDE